MTPFVVIFCSGALLDQVDRGVPDIHTASGVHFRYETEDHIISHKSYLTSHITGEPPDPARASEGVARAVCQALQPSLVSLRQEDSSPLAVRVSTQPDNVSSNISSISACQSGRRTSVSL